MTNSPRRSAHPLATVLLIVGIVAVLMIIWPWVGLAVGVVGVVLFVVLSARKAVTGRGIAGLVLSAAGAAGNVLVILLVMFVFPAIGSWVAHGGYDDNAGENSRYDEDYDPSLDYLIDTPCFSFTGPEGWINHQNDYFDADCKANLEDHGPRDESGRFVFDYSDENDYGSIAVEPAYGEQSVASADVELDGVDAALTVLDDGEDGRRFVRIEAVLPTTHRNYYGEVTAVRIFIDVDNADADAVIDELIDSWKWKK